MEEDDDVPDLIAVDAETTATVRMLEPNESRRKVPVTIVTGV